MRLQAPPNFNYSIPAITSGSFYTIDFRSTADKIRKWLPIKRLFVLNNSDEKLSFWLNQSPLQKVVILSGNEKILQNITSLKIENIDSTDTSADEVTLVANWD